MSDTDKPKTATPRKPRKRVTKPVDGNGLLNSSANDTPDPHEPGKPAPSKKVQASSEPNETSSPGGAPEVAPHASETRHSAKRGKRKPAVTNASGKSATAPAMTSTKPQATPATDPAQRDLIRVPMPVRWRDLDAFNHVNNSKYLSYLEEARLQWMLGVPGQGMDDHVAPVVAAAQLNYRRPITWPAEVMIELFVERLGNSSLTVGHRIVDAKDADVLYCDGHVVLVWIDRDSGASAPLPATVREACRESA